METRSACRYSRVECGGCVRYRAPCSRLEAGAFLFARGRRRSARRAMAALSGQSGCARISAAARASAACIDRGAHRSMQCDHAGERPQRQLRAPLPRENARKSPPQRRDELRGRIHALRSASAITVRRRRRRWGCVRDPVPCDVHAPADPHVLALRAMSRGIVPAPPCVPAGRPRAHASRLTASWVD